ncbi:MAG: hypothetical protein LC808_10745 [Actinobacteria bacterium]|nr:hypothetical protein [Actinomycetota bacterium]
MASESGTEAMRRRLLLVAFLVGLGFFHVAAPARAQVTSRPQLTSPGTWVGEVVVHENHLDYVGSPCPIETEICAAFIARYLIVPTTAQAFFALQSSVGGTAALTGRLLPVSFGEHHGVLFVSAVSQ